MTSDCHWIAAAMAAAVRVEVAAMAVATVATVAQNMAAVARAAEAWAVVVRVVTAAVFWVEARQPRTSAAAAIVARPTDPNGPMTARGRWTFGRPGTLTSTLGSIAAAFTPTPL